MKNVKYSELFHRHKKNPILTAADWQLLAAIQPEPISAIGSAKNRARRSSRDTISALERNSELRRVADTVVDVDRMMDAMKAIAAPDTIRAITSPTIISIRVTPACFRCPFSTMRTPR